MLGTTAFSQDVVVTMTNGTTEIIENADSVVYDVKVYGYYSFNATSKAEIKNLTANDFTKLTKATSEVDCGVAGFPVILTPEETTNAPQYQTYSNMDNGYSDIITTREGSSTTGTTKIINGKTYKLWYWANLTDALDNPKVKIYIK